MSVEHSENRILYIPKTRLGLRSAKSNIQQLRVSIDKQTAEPRTKSALVGMTFLPFIFLWNVNLLKARLGRSRSALILKTKRMMFSKISISEIPT